MKQAVLVITYKSEGKLMREPQGKFYYLDDKPTFLVNLTENKLFRKYNAWGIANQIVEAFRKTKTYPQILYRDVYSDTVYITNLSTISGKHAAFQVVGGHSQWFLPRPLWEAKSAKKYITDEPMNFPEMNIGKWMKTTDDEPNKTMSLFPGLNTSEQNDKNHKDYLRAQVSF